jgi:FkbM family methyltransferase
METAKLSRFHKLVRHAFLCYKNTNVANYLPLTQVLIGYVMVSCGLFRGKKHIINFQLGGIPVSLNCYSGEVTGFWENFLDDKYGTAKRRSKHHCVLDVGGNVGFFSMSQILQAESSLTLFTFEPDPEVFARMSRHLENCNQRNKVRLYPANIACGSQNGKVNLARNTSCLSHVATEADDIRSCVEASVQTLDSVVTAHKIEHIDPIKMDVEGFELEVLKGALTRALPITDCVVMQYHQGQLEETSRILQEAGFRPTWRNEEKSVALFEKKAGV